MRAPTYRQSRIQQIVKTSAYYDDDIDLLETMRPQRDLKLSESAFQRCVQIVREVFDLYDDEDLAEVHFLAAKGVAAARSVELTRSLKEDDWEDRAHPEIYLNVVSKYLRNLRREQLEAERQMEGCPLFGV